MFEQKLIYKDSFIIFNKEEFTWSFGNKYFENTLSLTETAGLKHLGLKQSGSGFLYAPAQESAIFSLKINFKKLTGKDYNLKSWNSYQGDREDIFLDLEIDCKVFRLDVIITFRIVSASTGFQQWVKIRPHEDGLTLHSLSPYDYTFNMEGLQLIAGCLRGCKHQGVTAGDEAYIPYEDFEFEQHELGRLFLKSGRRATEELLPYMLINETQSTAGLFLGVQWSGHWCMDACNFNSAHETNKIININGGPDEFYKLLVPAESFVSPKCYIGLFKGDLEKGADSHKIFLQAAVLPPKPLMNLPVAYNTWYAMEEKISETILLAEADLAAETGMEYFVIDAGWYGGSDSRFSCIGDFSKGQGDWVEDRTKFPSGLKSFSDYIHSKGMKFGLWVEPERVDLRTSDAGGWKTDWLSCDGNGNSNVMEGPLCKSGWLCLSEPEAREWIKGWLSELIEKYSLDWLKWDSNWWTICRGCHHGHGEGDGEYAHIEGLYEIYEYILNKYPGLVIENCAGGGTRMDTGSMQFSHVQWVDDESELPQRVRCHCSRLSRYIPQSCIYTFVCPKSPDIKEYEKFMNAGHKGIATAIDYSFRSRMMGVWGFSYRLGLMPPVALEVIKKNVEIYKKIRDIIVMGNFYSLIPIGRLQRPHLTVDGPEAYMFAGSDARKAVVFTFYSTQSGMMQIKLMGLNEKLRYKVKRIDDNTVSGFSGSELAETGLKICATDEIYSDIYFIEAEDTYFENVK